MTFELTRTFLRPLFPERLKSREKEFTELENCFANYRREVQNDLDELTASQKCHDCQTLQDTLDDTENDLREIELKLTRERRSHQAKVR